MKHLLFDCAESEEERKRMKEAVREEEERRTKEAITMESGGCARESEWGRLTILEENPGAVMGLLGDVLGVGSARVVLVDAC